MATLGRLAEIWRYPVKGLNGERLAQARLEAARGLVGDRRFAIRYGAARAAAFAPAFATTPPAAGGFVQLTREARLAQIEAAFDSQSGVLRLSREGRQVSRGQITEPLGRTLVEQFLAGFLRAGGRGLPKLVEAGDEPFNDSGYPAVSLVNLASARDLERVARGPVDPRRFRANLLIDGAPAWSEAEWIGREITLGTARLAVVEAIERCAATTVNPDTAERDLNVPKLLRQGYGHCTLGVYARVVHAGEIAEGDALTLAAPA